MTNDIYYYGFDKLLIRGQGDDGILDSSIQPSQIIAGSLDLGRIQLLPDENTGFLATDDALAEIFKIITGGTDVGDVIIGDASGANLKFDKSAGTFVGTSIDGTLGTITAGTLTGVTIQTATSSASARIYMTGSTMRFMDAGVIDTRYDIEISSVGSRISFFDWVGGTPSQTEQTRLSSADDYFLIDRYSNEGAQAGRYFFYDDRFQSTMDLGSSGSKWADAYFSGTINTGKIALVQTATTGAGLSISRDKPSTETSDVLVNITTDNADDDQDCLRIVNDGSGDGLYIYSRTNTYPPNPVGINLLAYSNGAQVYIDQTSDDDSNNIFSIDIRHNNVGTALPGGIDMSTFSVDEPLIKAPADAISSAGTLSQQIAVDIGGTVYYLYAYTTGS